ncbi:M1 family metallopeptidase [Gemmatimonas groenlandica]|uniref:Aminopeptidase N n=1 Tax=Gemmatimonas groenlandica TaxID=2732249 RepID=A0A6M4IT02_9BACT|nr:M1 family metallopeptidase [Gemmatimonas groenlandica]QJR35381.1 M1 family metallopeptidase [Gemmatimonas groenlandica]
MPRAFRVLAAASVLPVVLSSALAAQASPSRTGARRAGLDVVHYEFRVDFPARAWPDTIRFEATTTATRRDAMSLSLDLAAAMHVDSTYVNGARVAFTRPGDSVRVALPKGSNDTVRVAVYYRGLPTDGLIVRRDSLLGWTAFGDNFPDRARQWLATVDHPSDKALVDWIVRAPRTHRVIANGELVEETPEAGLAGAPLVRTHWRTVRPIYTGLMVIGVSPFAVLELGETACNLAERPGCVRQSVWTSPDRRAAMPGNFARAGDIVAFFSTLVGPFPYEKLAHVASSTRFGGMENAGAIFYDQRLFVPGAISESLIAHETAHQWFGDAVTEREWPHVWLSEGFATYFAALWTEHAHGDSAFLAEMHDIRAKMLKSPITVEKAVIDTTLDDLTRVLNTNVYEKAGFTLHMLRREIGDSAFFRGIRAYYAAHRHGNALTADLQQAFERSSSRQLDWFFDQWMRRPGYVDADASWSWNQKTLQLTVTVRQGTRFAPYRLSLAVDVTTASGTMKRVRVTVPAQRLATMTVPLTLAAKPRAVLFDGDVSLLGVLRQ